MITPCEPCKRQFKGVGASITGINGERWGRVWRRASLLAASHGPHCQERERRCHMGVEPRFRIVSEATETSPEKSDLLFVKGLGARTRPGLSVVNSEYIAYHPYQCLPMYEIE